MKVLDFADYRMRMRAGIPSARRSYYLAGLTHAARRGPGDLRPRQALADAIRAANPHVVVHDPVEAWQRNPTMATFHDLTALATRSEVCVAWFPTRESLTDAAAELQTAHRAGATIVAITSDHEDFLIRAYATVVVPSVHAFTEWVQAA